MDPIEFTVREHLAEDAQGSTEWRSEVRSFCGKFEEGSLNLKVHDALTARQQGHFDRAMSNIAEANRDQMNAIRAIQRLLGQVRGERYPEVVFEKFRQFEPFEIGISDADAVISILSRLDDEDDPQLKEDRQKLHDCELRVKDEKDYLSFLETRFDAGSAPEEVDKTRASVASLAGQLTGLRVSVLQKILVVVDEALNEMPPGIEKNRITLELSRSLFLVVTSPILTKPATQVETEM